jgi:hypothetical protein
MLMVGFHGTSAKPGSQICEDIKKYNLGAVILFDFNPVDKSKPKNIANKAQVARLTRELQACSRDGKLLIAVDQEGGKVQRLKSRYGFYGKFPKAADVVKSGTSQMKRTYEKMAKELKSVGINYDLAPVVDLDINPKNHVIHGLGRSFGKDPKTVTKYASIFIDAMHRYGVLTSLKHFPGHGSSVGDTHKGFVDVTNLWKPVELELYRLLNHKADTVMVAHVSTTLRLSSRTPTTFITAGNFMVTDESDLLNVEESKGFNWNVSFGLYANAIYNYYIIDEGIDMGYHLDPMKSALGFQGAVNVMYGSFKCTYNAKNASNRPPIAPASGHPCRLTFGHPSR